MDEWQLLHVSVLREYFDLEFRPAQGRALPWGAFDLERVIDDIVLICFFCGNDFLPQLPSLDIGEGALNDLFQQYRDLLPAMGGYITDRGEVDLTRMEVILAAVGKRENAVFVERSRDLAQFAQRKKRYGEASM
jgi:5'-3' exonuclease